MKDLVIRQFIHTLWPHISYMYSIIVAHCSHKLSSTSVNFSLTLTQSNIYELRGCIHRKQNQKHELSLLKMYQFYTLVCSLDFLAIHSIKLGSSHHVQNMLESVMIKSINPNIHTHTHTYCT